MSEPKEQPDSAQQQPEPVCRFLKAPARNKNFRKRTHDEDEEKGVENAAVNKRKQQKDKGLSFSAGGLKHAADADNGGDAKQPIFQFESSKEIQVQHDNKATLETETDFSRDNARAIRERVLKQAEEALKGKKKREGDEKLYKGIHGYTDYKAGFRREHTISSEKAGGSHGPLSLEHLRILGFRQGLIISRIFVKIIIKETGYCGYGVSCKFMHEIVGTISLGGKWRGSGMKLRKKGRGNLLL